MEIVRSATEFEVLDGRCTASGVGPNVVKLEKAPFGAAALGADERASTAVTLPHRSPDGRRNVACARDTGSRDAWMLDGRKFGPFEISDKQSDSSIDYLGQISGRNGVTQQILCSSKLVVRCASNCQLDLVAVGRDGRQYHTSGRRG